MKLGIIMKQFTVRLAVLILLAGTASAATIIGGAVGNGNFEDFSGGWVASGGTAGVNGTYPNYTRIWRSAGLDLTFGIDGWTARYRGGYVSFDTRTDAIPVGGTSPVTNKSFNLNQWSLAHLTSDTYSVSLAEDDELTLTFDTAGNLMRMNVAVILDKGLGSEWTRWLVGSATTTVDFVTTDHTDFQNAGVFTYTLGTGESASTATLFFTGYREDQGGADYGMIKRNNGTGCIDNVELTADAAVPATDYYVATVANGGDDSNPGTLAEPFATIQHAASQIQPGHTVYIRGGTYRETITPPQSGTVGNPITFEAYNGEKVIISGCDLVTGWTQQGTSNIWYADNTWDMGGGAGNTLFVNGVLQFEARHPSTTDPMKLNNWGEIPSGALTSTGFTSTDLVSGNPDGYWNGATVRYHTHDWVIRNSEITGYDASAGTITFPDNGGVSQKQALGFYIYDTILALDDTGEWYKDVGADTLYYQVPPTEDPSTMEIEFKSRQYGFDLDDRDYITISGITFRGVSIDTNSGTDYNIYKNNKFYGYDRANYGRFYLSGSNNVFRDNEVSQVWGGALSVGGTRQDIINNNFHDIGYNGTSRVFGMSGENHFVCRNTVSKFARSFLDGYPIDCEFSYNLFEDGANLSWDTGVFDGDGGGGNGGRCIVHHNVFRDSPSVGIYCAFYAGLDLVIHHNIVHDITGNGPSATLRAGQLQFIKYYHNTLIGLNPVGNTNAADYAFQARYNNNLQASADYITSIGINCRGNYDYSQSDFVDFANNDYRLVAGSGAIDAGIVIPKINEGYSGAAPDAGALEEGEPMFEVGHDFVTPPTPTFAWEAMPGMNLFSNGQFGEALSGWTYINSPVRFSGNSWNCWGTSLSSTANYSIQMQPGDGMYRTFDNLFPDTWYAIATETRIADQRIEMEQYDSINGSVTSGNHRGENYITGLDDGEWVRYNSVDFGSTGKYNQLELTFSRPSGTPVYSTVSSLEAHLGSDTGQLLGTFEYNPSIQDAWWVSQIDIPAVSGYQNVVFIGKGPDAGVMMLANVRLINNNMDPDNKASVVIDNHGGPTITTRIGDPYWQDRYETVVFKTGPAATSARLTIRNDGIYDAYLDRLAIYELDEFNNQLPTYAQVSTSSGSSAAYAVDGDVYTEAMTGDQPNSWLLLELDSPLDMHQITLTASSVSPEHLSNFKVSVWANDPQLGGSALWQRSYITSGFLAAGETLSIKPTDMSADGITQLNKTVGRYVKVELLGQNNLGNGILEIAEIDVEGYDEMDMVITDGLENSIGSMHEVTFVQVVNIGRITLYNVDSEDYKELSNFTVSVWDRDPALGGSVIWEKDYFQAGCVAKGDHFHIPGSEIGSDGITRLASLTGRVIRITNNGVNFAGNTNLSLERIRIYNIADAQPEANVAMGGIASQSSNHYARSGFAEVANNGVILPISDFTSTRDSYRPWWQVDLMDIQKIEQLVLFTRTDADSRIGNFHVSVWDGDPESSGSELWSNGYSYPGDINGSKSLVINGNVTSGGTRLDELTGARFVRVQLDGYNFLHLAEVQVWADLPASPDMDRNDKINLADFARFSQCWLDHARQEADFTNDDLVNIADLQKLIERWLEGVVVY